MGGLAKQANANFAKQNEQTVANVAVNDNVNVSDSVSVNDIKKKASPSDEIMTILEDLNKRTKSKKGFSPLAQCNQNEMRFNIDFKLLFGYLGWEGAHCLLLKL